MSHEKHTAASVDPQAEIAQLKHALSRCVPWVATSGRGMAQETLAIACDLLGIDPYDYSAHPDVLTRRREFLMTEKSYRTMLVQHARRDEHRFKELARDALHRLAADVEHALAALESDRVRQSTGGSVLNHQNFMDAERNLVRWWDARCVCAVVEDATEEA